MKTYILNIVGIVLISAVVTIIAPSGKMGKFIKGTTRLFLLIVLISPIINWVRTESPSFESSSTIQINENYLLQCADVLQSRDEEEIEAYIEKEFCVSSKVDVKRQISALFPIEQITINLSDEGINETEERIYMINRIKEAVETRYGCKAEVL